MLGKKDILKKTSSTKKSSSAKNRIVPDIRRYLTADFISRNFENSTLKYTSTKSLNSLISTGDLKHLRSISSIQSIYREKVFWDQIHEWKKLAYDYMYYQDQHNQPDHGNIGEILLETVIQGFKSSIFTYKTTKAGRPSKSLPNSVDILKEYANVERELVKNTIHNMDLNEIRDCKTKNTINREWAKKRIQDIVQRRKKCLKKVIKEMNIQLTKKQFDKLVLSANAVISYNILAKLFNVGIRKIKEELSVQGVYSDDYINTGRAELVILIELPDGSIVTIDFTRYEEAKEQASKNCKDPESYFDNLSKILSVPVKAIRKYHTDGGKLGFKKLRTPHLSKPSPKKSQKS